MKQSEAVNAMIRKSNRTQEYVGQHMNPQLSQGAIARILNNGNMTVNRLWEICEVLGYEIVVRPSKKGAANSDNTFKIDGETKADRAKKLNKKDGAE